MASARRCTLCYGFDGDLRQKKGQIAHIDHNPANAKEENLVYLCLEHHDEYDSKTTQAKRITPRELQKYKQRLIAAIGAGIHTRSEKAMSATDIRNNAIRGHDERLFKESDGAMRELLLREFLDQLRSDHSYLLSRGRSLDAFRAFFSETGNQYIDHNLSAALRRLLATMDSLLVFLARHFFVYPKDQRGTDDTRLCMYPKLNADRDGDGSQDSMARYNDFAKQLDQATDGVQSAYNKYRNTVKRVLYL